MEELKTYHFVVFHKPTQRLCYDWDIEAKNYKEALKADDSVDIIRECKK